MTRLIRGVSPRTETVWFPFCSQPSKQPLIKDFPSSVSATEMSCNGEKITIGEAARFRGESSISSDLKLIEGDVISSIFPGEKV